MGRGGLREVRRAIRAQEVTDLMHDVWGAPKMPSRGLSTLESWHNASVVKLNSLDWRALISSAVQGAFDADPGNLAALRELSSRIRKLDPQLAQEVDSETSKMLVQTVEFAAVLGYALAKTWPDNVEGLDDWLASAITYASTR